MRRTRETTPRLVEIDRVAPFRLRDAGEAGGDGRTLDGYASVFNSETVIDSWEGRFREQFLPGSMAKSFRSMAPIVQFDHGKHPMIGSLPIARFSPGFPREEVDPELAPNGGAHVVARLHDSPLFEPVREVIATGTVNGMSIRFGPTRERWYTPDGERITDPAVLDRELSRSWFEDIPDEELLRRDIVEATVAEMGPVVWPAYLSTSVGVRALEPAARSGWALDTDPVAPDTLEGDGNPDSERQAADESRTPSRRQMADSDTLRLRGIIPARKGD